MTTPNNTALTLRQGAAAHQMFEMCSVRVGQTLFGLPITYILEIVGDARPQVVPLAPAFIGGLVHYRGDVLTTVSLRQLLGLPATDAIRQSSKTAPRLEAAGDIL